MHKYLKDKGISNEIIKRFEISFKTTDGDNIAFFPVHDINGKVLFHKYRHHGQSMMNPSGGYKTLYGINFVKKSNKVILTEGETDVLAAHSIGLPAVTSTTGATSTYSPEMIDAIKDKEIYICMDNDDAGHHGMSKLYKTFPDAKFVFLTDEEVGHKGDLSDYIKNNTRETVINRLRGAEIVPEGFESPYGYVFTTKEEKPKVAHYKRDYRLDVDDETRRLRAKEVPFETLVAFNRENKAICPFHRDTNASLSLKKDKNFVKCFVCDKWFDTIGFVMERDNKLFYEAIEELIGPKVVKADSINFSNHV